MTFISYAQNYEDVILYRALGDIGAGFYIDVGAQDPVVDSVTKAFYERGWRGINIEPIDYWFNKLIADRPQDQNLKVAAAAENGILQFYEVVDTGMSTFNATFASKHSLAGFTIRECQVPARRLDKICDELNVTVVHFLKIDVEGAERAVLAGIDLTRIRPWVILLESTEPNSTVPTYEQWEDLLTSRGYEFACFDGLNRYYLADERKAPLKEILSKPPNYFDHFIRHSEWLAGQQVQKLEAEATRTQKRVEELENEVAKLQIESGDLREKLKIIQEHVACLEKSLFESRVDLQVVEKELAEAKKMASHFRQSLEVRELELKAVYSSLSWRITEPLRRANLFVKQSVRTIEKR
ncbi:FkbM family methyltransferase [Candidatus Manganitrophus noduliformans]|uniref:FkbM family methyltransferase n=1 Tax=Candidatus Manganitrophus noduliformans TaxID=2606439 RepID=A0A7X6DPI3_9BACT|nr:FkbM family methyltransferase [Candidatus Manganitrophus noduliformans]NKE70965.1 FkbM family methyltransferase [Candidatus Manganitrophus noduliformans]